jgi:Zn finger protein HypA/HybF involved in hydrogenase expression
MSNDIIRFTISLPTDQGFLGRECNNPECKGYFRVHKESLKQEMYCPYCGILFPNDKLWTDDQNRYVTEVTKEKATEYFHKEIDKALNDLARNTAGNPFIKVTHHPNNYRAKTVTPNYKEHQVDSELTCPSCDFRFQVYGIFGYCPGCRNENLVIYDANLEIIKLEVSAGQDPQRALRHAYADLVSTFEAFCKRKAQTFTTETTHFQKIFESRKFFKDHLGIDFLEDLNKDELLALRRVFQKRHAYEHYQGVIEEKYVRIIPEDSGLLNQKAELSLDEFVVASQALRKVLDKLIQTKKP